MLRWILYHLLSNELKTFILESLIQFIRLSIVKKAEFIEVVLFYDPDI